MAPLQSAFRVIKKPNGGPNAISFQLGATGMDDTRGGYFTDVSREGGGAPPSGPGQTVVGRPPGAEKNFVHALGSVSDGGPFDAGTGNCGHRIGTDDDGFAISSLHLSTQAAFRANDNADGPILFELEHKEGDDLNVTVPVHLAWNGAFWAGWTTTAMAYDTEFT